MWMYGSGTWTDIPVVTKCTLINAEELANYETFQQDDSDHLKLLSCVNMRNEGVHVACISRVILSNPTTVSLTICKLQNGRAMTVASWHRVIEQGGARRPAGATGSRDRGCQPKGTETDKKSRWIGKGINLLNY